MSVVLVPGAGVLVVEVGNDGSAPTVLVSTVVVDVRVEPTVVFTRHALVSLSYLHPGALRHVDGSIVAQVAPSVSAVVVTGGVGVLPAEKAPSGIMCPTGVGSMPPLIMREG